MPPIAEPVAIANACAVPIRPTGGASTCVPEDRRRVGAAGVSGDGLSVRVADPAGPVGGGVKDAQILVLRHEVAVLFTDKRGPHVKRPIRAQWCQRAAEPRTTRAALKA